MSATSKKALLALVATCAAIAMGESIVRCLAIAPAVKVILSKTESAYQRSTDPLLGFELKPNYKNADPDFVATYESTNSYGQRDREWPRQKTTDVHRILLLGDSVVEGLGLHEHDTMSRQMQQLYHDGSTEILNFGVSGYCTRAEIQLLERKGLSFQPDVVILVFVENDFDNFNVESQLLTYPAGRPSYARFLFTHSHLFRLLAIRCNLYQYGAEADPSKWNASAIGDNNVVEGLSRFTELARENHFLPLVAIWPSFRDTDVQDPLPLCGGHGALIIERLATMHGIPSIRMSRFFSQDRLRHDVPNPRTHYSIGDQMHPSPEGCRVAAEGLKQLVSDFYGMTSIRDNVMHSLTNARSDPEAIAAARGLGGHNVNRSIVYCNLAEKLREEGKTAEAVAYLRLSIADDPGYYLAHNKLGYILEGQGKLAEAKACYERALQLNAGCYHAHYNLGNIAWRDNDVIEARMQYEQALHIMPDCAEVHCAFGRLLAKQQQYNEACLHYRQAIAAKPQFVVAHVGLANVLLQQGKYAEARAESERAIQIDPMNSMAYRTIGTVFENQHNIVEAQMWYERALALDSSNEMARNDLARLQQLQQRPK